MFDRLRSLLLFFAKTCRYLCAFIITTVCQFSCKTLEKASLHGLNSGYYALDDGIRQTNRVYAEVDESAISIHAASNSHVNNVPFLKIPMAYTDSPVFQKIVLKKQGLDIDITSVLMKYRPSVSGLPAQLSTDLNLALYAGWRHDRFSLENTTSPVGKNRCKISNRGYDFGFFAGPGATLISPFTTRGKRPDEYNGMIIQAGFAGFLETNMASFGLAVGLDHLLSPDRNVWIYNRKPWLGFVVGVALNLG